MPTKGKLRIFHLIKSLGRGGAEMLLVDGPPRSDPNRYEYGFGYFLPWKDAVVPEIAANFGEVTCFDANGAVAMLARTRDVARYVKAWNADVLHCHLPLASIVGRLAGAMSGVPVVTTEHNLQERYHPVTRIASLATWRLQRRVIAVSSEVAASIMRYAGTSVPVQVVQNGVHADRFVRGNYDARAVKAALGIAADALVVGTAAVFRVQKRLDLWLEAAHRIRSRNPKAAFVIVGDGPLRQEVEAKIGELGLGGSVKLTGLREDVRPFLAAMDIYLVSSDFEGLPIALLEAMAMEVVPVATGVGGIPEVLSGDAGGVVVPRGDVAALARAVEEALALSAERRGALGALARRRVADAFSTDRMMRGIERVYEEVVANG